MPVTNFYRREMSLRAIMLALALAIIVIAASDVFAQSAPFGVPRPQTPAAAPDGIIGWLLAKQAEFYRALSGAIRAAKADGSAVWGLFSLSFLYGIFHAAGPGHGKAVISSYVVANDETWRRGIVLSFASAFLQALVAVALVGVAAILLGATARAMSEVVRYIEIISYSLIALLGLRLLWVRAAPPLRHSANCRPSTSISSTHMRMHMDILTIIMAMPITRTTMSTTSIVTTRTARSRRISPVRAAGSAA